MEPHDTLAEDQRFKHSIPDLQTSIKLHVNGIEYQHHTTATETLSQFLRDTLRLTGVKVGCGEGECGACTVLIGNQPVNSCLVLAFQANGKHVTTIEGLEGPNGVLSPLQQAFLDHGAVQCGYCTPGMVLASEGLLRRNPNPDDAQIRNALAGNICRCTGFLSIVKAVKSISLSNSTSVVE